MLASIWHDIHTLLHPDFGPHEYVCHIKSVFLMGHDPPVDCGQKYD